MIIYIPIGITVSVMYYLLFSSLAERPSSQVRLLLHLINIQTGFRGYLLE